MPYEKIYNEAVEIINNLDEKIRLTVGFFQRKFLINYNNANELIQKLIENKILNPLNKNGYYYKHTLSDTENLFKLLNQINSKLDILIKKLKE